MLNKTLIDSYSLRTTNEVCRRFELGFWLGILIKAKYIPQMTMTPNLSLEYAALLEFVTGGIELLRAILHGYAGGLIFIK